MLPYSATARLLLNNAAKFVTAPTANLLHTSQINHKKKSCRCGPKKVAMILCGCGVLDGTEVSEAVSAMIHLSHKGYETRFFAPDMKICSPMNHLTKDVEACPDKNALVEAARIARGNIKSLCECSACEHAGLVIPGGFGVGRTLSDFAAKGCNCVLLPDLIRIIEEFNCQDKPIGGICIAAALIPKVLKGARVTLGKDCPKERYVNSEAIEQAKSMGANIDMQDAKGATECKEHNVFTTPAFMDSCATNADIHEGIGKMISMMSKIMK
ncbi:ES1 protein homolog, mitochondrial-like [Copidosoma floridanum]|uniref:ES1 protein homolog, mitochondrial-like n=1 Tax=Copidosoma floridanum TaxID=29053 RepID=UPI0006C9589D|nr:ES1 protein homolog, mitochondrial-like [Copidosoma floridanum]